MEPMASWRGCSSVVERSLRMRDVPGSIPGVSKNIFELLKYLTVVGFEPTPFRTGA